MAHVRVRVRVHVVLRGEVQDARPPDVLEQRRVARSEAALEEDALAQPCLGDLDAVEAPQLDDGLDDQRAAEDDVAARRLDPGHLPALGRGELREVLDEVVEHLAGQHETLHAELGDAVGPLGRRAEVPHSAAYADEPAPRAPQPAQLVVELARHVLAQRGDLLRLGGSVAGQEALGHAHGAEAPGAGVDRAAVANARELH